jgi:hypothetical protein
MPIYYVGPIKAKFMVTCSGWGLWSIAFVTVCLTEKIIILKINPIMCITKKGIKYKCYSNLKQTLKEV